MIIDKKGKLFGKISINDILIVIIVAGALAGVAYKLIKSNVAETSRIQVVLYSENILESGVKPIKEGETVIDKQKNTVLGKVVKIETGPSIVYTTDANGNIVVSSKPGHPKNCFV